MDYDVSMHNVVELVVVIPTSPRSSKSESGCKSYRVFGVWLGRPSAAAGQPSTWPGMPGRIPKIPVPAGFRLDFGPNGHIF